MMTRYDPHPQDYDDARTTPHGFTGGPSAAQDASGVPEEGGGLREALEALADEWEWDAASSHRDTMARAMWVGALEGCALQLRAVLAAHPADAPAQAPEPSGDVVERAARVLAEYHHLGPEQWRGEAHALADAGLLVDPEVSERAEWLPRVQRDLDGMRLLRDEAVGERDRARARVAELEAEDPAAAEHYRVCDRRAWVERAYAAERQRDEARARVAEHRLVCDQCHATKATLRAAQADRNQWKRAAEITGEEIGRWRQSLITVEGERDRARDLAAALEADNARLTEERDKVQRACEMLGRVLEAQCNAALDATGLHDWIDETGDGDWGAIWENLASLGDEKRAAEARARRAEDALRAVRDNTKHSAMQRAIIDRALSTEEQR